jgi:hypothetical protein
MELSAEFFDIFGIAVFTFILVAGLLIKFKRRKLSNNIFDKIAIGLIIVGVLGLIVDTVLVGLKFFR